MLFTDGEVVQKSLLAFIKLKRVVVLHRVKTAAFSDKLNHDDAAKDIKSHQISFLTLSGVEPYTCEKDKILENKVINENIRKGLEDFCRLELVTSSPSDKDAYFKDNSDNQQAKCTIYQLTAKGFESALKMQEHRDDTKRSEKQIAISSKQIEISATLKENSSKALKTSYCAIAISCVVVLIAFLRMHIVTKQFNEVNEQFRITQEQSLAQLNIAKTNSNNNKKQVSMLKKHLIESTQKFQKQLTLANDELKISKKRLAFLEEKNLIIKAKL